MVAPYIEEDELILLQDVSTFSDCSRACFSDRWRLPPNNHCFVLDRSTRSCPS